MERVGDSAFGALLVAGDGTENSGVGHAMRSQIGFALPKLVDDLVAPHSGAFIAKG